MHITIARAGTLAFILLLTVTLLTAERTAADAATAPARPARPVGAASSVVRADRPADILAAPTLSAPDAKVFADVAMLGEETALASWYGPGLYGNRTACGQTYSAQILGVAHRTLPCGTLLVLSYGGRTVAVPVIDRGPYVAGRTLDLSAATKGALGCPDLCALLMQFAH